MTFHIKICIKYIYTIYFNIKKKKFNKEFPSHIYIYILNYFIYKSVKKIFP